jgi:hypothetical protein
VIKFPRVIFSHARMKSFATHQVKKNVLLFMNCVIQSSAATFRSRVYHPRTGRAPSRLIPCPLNRGKVTVPFRVQTRTPQGVAAIPADLVVHAAGRVPDIGELNLIAGTVEVEKWRLRLNEYLQSVSPTRSSTCCQGRVPATPCDKSAIIWKKIGERVA